MATNESQYRGLIAGDAYAALDTVHPTLCQPSNVQVVQDRSTLPESVRQKAEEVKRTENIAVVETADAAYIILSAGEKPTGGYQFIFHNACALEELLLIKAEVQPPAPDAFVTQVITYPQLILKSDRKYLAYFWVNKAEATTA